MGSISDEIGGDIGKARELYQQNLPNAALERLDPRNSYQSDQLGALRWSQANPAYSSYAGNFSADTKELLNLRKSQLDPTSKNYAGAVSSSTQALLNQRKQQSDPNSTMFAGQRSDNMRDIISRFRQGLDGYSSTENQALRESASREIDQDFNTRRNDATLDMARGRVGGAGSLAALRDLDRSRIGAQRGLSQDLFVKNVDEKQSRLKDFAGLMSSTEGTEYDRARAALADYQSLLGGTESDSYNRVQQALEGYQGFQQGAEKEYYGRGQAAIQSYQDLLQQMNADVERKQTFNIGQGEKESARDVGGIMGLLGLMQTRRSAKEQNDILKKKK